MQKNATQKTLKKSRPMHPLKFSLHDKYILRTLLLPIIINYSNQII